MKDKKNKNLMNNKKGEKKSILTMLVSVSIIGLFILGILAASSMYMAKKADGSGGSTLSVVEQAQASLSSCPTDGGSTVTFDLYNGANTTGTENFDSAYYIYDDTGSLVASGTDSTSGSLSLNCGETLTLRLASADGDGGDNAVIDSIRSAAGLNAVLIENGRAVQFTTAKDTHKLSVVGSQHGVLQARMYDNVQAGWIANGDDSATDFETDGATFQSTVNGTAMAVGSAGEVDVRLELKSTGVDTDASDFGFYILVDAATTVWNTPNVKFEGAKLADIKGSLDSSEARAYSAYEYVYFVNEKVLDDGKDLDVAIKALSGVNPGASDNLEFDFVAKGAVKQISGDSMRYAGVDDSSSTTTVFAVQDYTLDIS